MFISPKTDFAFKRIFGSPQTTDILIGFLNAILYDGENRIESLKILDPHQGSRTVGMKDTFLDIKAKLDNDTTVVIEMQVINVLGFKQRILYNTTKFYSTQLKVGDGYPLLNPVIALTITDFVLFPEIEKVISRFALQEQEVFTRYSDDFEMIFIELPKFKKKLEFLESISDKWIYFLKYASQLQSIPAVMEDEPALEHAFQVAEQSRLSVEELEVLERQSMLLHDKQNAILLAEQEGEERGVRQGMQQASIAIARQLFDVLDLETISQKTGLTVEELRSIQQSNQTPE